MLGMRSKAWLAVRMSLRLVRLPRTASSAQRSRHLRSTRAAAPLAVLQRSQKLNIFSMRPERRYPTVRSNYDSHIAMVLAIIAAVNVLY